jgi:hypothetical protein
MLVNTFLPAIVIVTLGLMIWSTSTTLSDELCAIDDALDRVEIDKEKGYPKPSVDALINDIERPSDSRGNNEPPCELFEAIDAVFYDQLVAQTRSALQTQFANLQIKIAALGKSVGKSFSMRLEPPEGAGAAAKGAIKQFNKRLAGPMAVPVKSGMNEVRKLTYAVFQPQTENIARELRKADHKRQVVWKRMEVTYAAQMTKFQWFFVALAAWLVLGYVFWIQRRLLIARRLLRDDDPF